MPIRDILLPLVGEPSAAAIATIDKCMAMAGDIGAQVTAMAVEEDVLVRPKVMISDDLDNTAVAEAVRSVTDAQGLLKAFDAAVVPIDVFKDAGAKGRFAPASIVDIARVGYGVIVRAGAPKPDISTPEAFKQAMLAAPSIAYVPPSAAGAYIGSVFEKLGIDKKMEAKTKQESAPVKIVPAVAAGKAALGVFLMNVLVGPGVELVGPLPADLQQELVFTAGIASDSKQADAAKALIDFLRTPAGTAAFKAAGMTPG